MLPPADPLAWQNYTCICDNGIDRQFAHQTTAQIKQICGSSSRESLGGEEKAEGGFPGMDCNCSASSLATSAKYAGFMPFVLPVYATLPYCNLCKHASTDEFNGDYQPRSERERERERER